jgi:four helix bundle protein
VFIRRSISKQSSQECPTEVQHGQSYKDLFAWQKAMDLVISIHKCTAAFPRDETYGLAAQLRRIAVLIPRNIAEGQARFSPGEFFSFLGRARGALGEVETQVILSQCLRYLSDEQAQQVLDRAAELGKILNGLISAA